jgi:hypothetical protein
MAEIVEQRQGVVTRTEAAPRAPWYQAFRILHLAFIVAPTIAGLDKFFHVLVSWDQYLAPQIARLLPMSGSTFMLLVGAVEVAVGLLVALKPKWGGAVVAAWMLGIIINLVIAGSYWDVALRDLGLMLGAVALVRLARQHELDRGYATTSLSR